jgi:hypothetical protein
MDYLSIVMYVAMLLFILSLCSINWRLFGIGIDGSLWRKYDPLRKLGNTQIVILWILSLVLLVVCSIAR